MISLVYCMQYDDRCLEKNRRKLLKITIDDLDYDRYDCINIWPCFALIFIQYKR